MTCSRTCSSPCRLALPCGPWKCALEFVEAHPGGATLAEVGAVLGITHEAARVAEAKAAASLVRALFNAGLLERGRIGVPRKDWTPAITLAAALGVVPPAFEHAPGFAPVEGGDDEP